MFKALQFKLKVFKAYFRVIFLPHEDEKDQEYTRTWFLRYANYSIGDSLCVVDNRIGRYVMTKMPWPFHIPGHIYWWIVDKKNNRI